MINETTATPAATATGGLDVLRGELEKAGVAKFLPRFPLPLSELTACFGQGVYDRFTEGFVTADLKAATALLEASPSLEKVRTT